VTSYLLSSQAELSLARYLERYAEPFVQRLDSVILDTFDTVIVIPIYDEAEQQLQQLLNFRNNTHHQTSTLMIWVFNAPESSLHSPSLERTQSVFKRLVLETQANKLAEDLYLSKAQESLQVLFVDRCHEHLIPDKQGVGLARKLGMDLALKLIYQQYQVSQKWCSWIYSTDADVSLPESYGLLPPKENTTACIYPFKHISQHGFERAMAEYEFSLHYYVESLKKAGSPYAFHTIGSLIVVSSLAYAQVRGMPKRSGAEDFYLLNKLAKLGKVESLNEPLIQVSGRPSHRVPFGTGPALVKINAQYEKQECFSVYHPRIFILLECVLSSVAEIEHSSAEQAILLSRLTVKLLDPFEKKRVSDILLGLGWNKQAAHLRQLKTTGAIQKAFHVWFDAFITLRFIHELRDCLYPNIDLTALPKHLAEMANNKASRGTDFDYTAWFKALGI
tara:strand:- start:298 stop:1638 length:1341 start_codon:yes stop_codon:yes gene_type:complete